MAATSRAPATEADLLRSPDDGQKYELVDGAIRVSPGGARHGAISIKLGARLLAFVEAGRLGYVLDSSTGFRLPGGNVRSPDVSVVVAGRFPKDVPPEDFGNLAPDLAIEVLSSGDRPRHVLDKVGEYLEAGVRLVWVIDPRSAKAVVYRSLSDVRELGPGDDLNGADVLPGFRCRLGDVLA
jgi:Uma2 family endonuclease